MKYCQRLFVIFMVSTLGACTTTATHIVSNADLHQQVINTERAFAKTMTDRDFKAFSTFVSDEAIFFAGDKQLHGKQEVLDWWKDFYTKPEAPFSWEPETVEVLPSGTLALSTGPVHNAQGKLIGTFSSIWRLEAPNAWHIVFDKGNPVCN
jgi:ketosteroid isomerase-like protein